MDCYIINRVDIEGRLDPHFYNPTFIENVKKLKDYNAVSLGQLVEFSNEIWNQLDYYEDEFPYIEIGEIDIHTGENKKISLIKKENVPSRARMIVRKDDIIVSTTRPNRGAISFIDESKDGYIASTGFAVLRELKRDDLIKEYLFHALRLNTSLMQMLQRSSGGNYPAIVQDELAKILLPVPSRDIQIKVIQIMDAAYSKKRQNEEEAEKLLNSYAKLINEHIEINLNSSIQRKIFSIFFDELNGPLNPERYANKLTLDKNFSWISVNDIGDVIRETFTPSRTNPENKYGLIRIDDLENNPQDAEIRDVQGKEINGTILKVQENDILIARLGPTLENKKTIIAPNYKRELIASNEFICLRCKENVNPVFILIFLKTDFYRNLMIQKSRGATPSRRRLSHEDFAELPFPDINKIIQNEIANKFIANIVKAQNLKKEAVETLEKAKEEVEIILFE
jgi:restriction endonuclease S subunit